MTQSVPSTFSPSSLRMTRSTPCVDGCCGPMLRTSSVESKKVDSAIALVAALDAQVLLYPAVILLQDRIVFAQGIAFPLLGQQDAPHIGMPREFDPKHIEHFAFQPVGGKMHRCGRGRARALGDGGLDPD